MTSPANDTSELTAYSLGELHPHQAGDIHKLLSDCPAATSELEQIEAVTDALRQRAPIPQERLLPEQRHAVLRPTNIPRRVAPMMPRQVVKKPASFWPVMGGLIKAAAVITLTGAAYWAGRHADLGNRQTAVANMPVKLVTPAPEKIEIVVPRPKSAPLLVKTPPSAPTPTVVVSAPAPRPTVKTPVEIVTAPQLKAPAPKQIVISSPMPAPVIPVAVTHPITDVVFISTSRQATDQFSLRPADIRPAPVRGGKDSFASPAAMKSAPQPRLDAKMTKADLFIHSWKAEIASCPWNNNTRLMRITMQLPADQPAAITPNAYPLQVSFDRRNVREFRRLSERHLPAVELRSAGSQTVWYEFQPVSDDGVESGKSIAMVTLEKGRFTTQTVGPFDSSKLNVQDRGITWQTAREDFIFESAVVGLSMLLRGDHQSPELSHRLVLALAEKGKGSDATGERARFIRQVNEARSAAGL
ncbi:MAG: YfbK domain-containing protein [Prosthecobacter sp.]